MILAACTACGLLHPAALNSDLCGGCFERGVLIERPRFGRGGKILREATGAPAGLRAVALFVLALLLLGALGARFLRPEPVRVPAAVITARVDAPVRAVSGTPKKPAPKHRRLHR
jgi:hypothetical protein